MSEYFRSLFGKSINGLWWNNPIVDCVIGSLGVVGLILGVVFSKNKLLFGYLVIALIFQISFMSFFYSLDGRYIYIAIPVIFFGFTELLYQLIQLLFHYMNRKLVIAGYLIVFLMFYLSHFGIAVKNQIMLNIKHQETPWSYEAVLNLNEYFSSIVNKEKRIVISPLPPFYINYFSNGDYELLPLSQNQEFRDYKDIVWGQNDYSNLPSLYTRYLKQGTKLYVAPYGVGAEKFPNKEFEELQKNFNLTKVL